MGGTKYYLETGGFSYYDFKTIGKTVNGIKILEKINGNNSSLPLYSNTPYTMYAIRDSKLKTLKQITIYSSGKDGRQKTKDLDWSHGHGKFSKGEIHVHIYEEGKKLKYYRKPSKKERRIVMKALYGR